MGNVSGNYYGSPPSYSSLYPSSSSGASASGLSSSAGGMDEVKLSGDGLPPSYEQAMADTPPPYRQASAKTVDPNNKGVHGFLGGMWDGVKGAVHSLFTPKGALMAAAGVAACIAFPVAAPLILGGTAVAIGGAHMAKGFKDGNMREVGNGTTGVLMGAGGVAGARAFGPKGETASAGESASESAAAQKPGIFSRGMSTLQGWVTGKPAENPTGTPVEELPPQKPPGPVPQNAPAPETQTPGLWQPRSTTTEHQKPGLWQSPKPPVAEVKPPVEEPQAPAPEPQMPAAEADAAAQDAGTKMGPWDRLKNSQQGQYFSKFGQAVKDGQGFKGKMSPFAAPASMLPATGYNLSSFTPQIQQQA